MGDIEQRGQTAANQQVSMGLTARDPASLPPAVDAGDGVDAISDLYGRQQVYIAGALASATVTANIASGSMTITGTATVAGTTTSLTVPVATASSTIFSLSAGTVVSAGTALAANAARTKWYVQNVGTVATWVYLGAASSISAGTTFSFVLSPDIAQDNGYGGKEQGYNYTGQISCTAGTAAVRLAVVEL